MARTILIVNATQVVTSDSHPEGLFSMVSGYPKTFDSTNYSDDIELNMKKAKAEYYNRLGINYDDTNPVRVMKTVTLETADGRQILRDSIGSLPAPEEPAEE